MKTIEELKTRIQELSKQAVELRQKASEVYLTNQEQAKQFRQEAREANKRCQVLIQELKRQQV
jgi:ribosomal protein L29